MKVSFRQGIARHQTDIYNNPTFLNLSGTKVSLIVSSDPTIIIFAHGSATYLFTEISTITNAWDISGGINRWLYWDIDLTTGIRSFGNTSTPPTVGTSAPGSPVTNQHWFDASTKTMKVWNGSSWIPKVRVFAAKYNAAGNNLTSVSSNSPLYTGTQAGLASSSVAGALIFDNLGKPVKKDSGEFFTTVDEFMTGVPSGTRIRIEAAVVEATAQENIPKFSMVKFSGFGKIVLADENTTNSVVYGIVEEDAIIGETVSVVITGTISNPDWNWSAVNTRIYIGNSGELVESPLLVNQTVIGIAINSYTILLRPY